MGKLTNTGTATLEPCLEYHLGIAMHTLKDSSQALGSVGLDSLTLGQPTEQGQAFPQTGASQVGSYGPRWLVAHGKCPLVAVGS